MENFSLDPHVDNTLKNLDKVVAMIEEKWVISPDKLQKLKDFLVPWKIKKFTTLIWWSQIQWSLSPFMHTFMSCLEDKHFLYTLLDMDLENISADEVWKVLDYIEGKKEILWSNVTMPFKIKAYDILAEKQSLDTSAQLAWAVNTLAKKNGKLIWYNTDMEWVALPIRKKLWSDLSKVDAAYILGSWWAAHAAIAWVLSLWIKKIHVFNRTTDNLIEIVNHFNTETVKSILKEKYKIEHTRFTMTPYDLWFDDKRHIHEQISENWILINTLPFWFKENFSRYPIYTGDFDKVFPKLLLYFDAVYDMSAPHTPMVGHLKEHYPDIKICDWRDMVIHQACKWFNLWTQWWEMDTELLNNAIR